jgi:hypothetical protein
MRTQFIAALFVSLGGFGIWFQQTYMDLYSQEFELEKNADRSKSTLVSGTNIDSNEFRRGIRVSSFQAHQAMILNNGTIFASGDLVFNFFRGDGTVHSTYSTARLSGELVRETVGKSFLDSKSRLEHVTFPADISGVAGGDKIKAKGVTYWPETQLYESNEPIEWTGPNRYFHGMGFQFVRGPDALNVTGPVKGNFMPGKDTIQPFQPNR